MSKRYSVTKSQYSSLLKGGVARSCNTCDYEVPKYVGRYSSSCATSDCDGEIGMPHTDEDLGEGRVSKALKQLRSGVRLQQKQRAGGLFWGSKGSPQAAAQDKLMSATGKTKAAKLGHMLSKHQGKVAVGLGLTAAGTTAAYAYKKLKNRRVKDAVESIIIGNDVDSVIAYLLEKKSNLKKWAGAGAGIGAVAGGVAGYRNAKKEKTSKLKGALGGAAIGALGGAALGTASGMHRDDVRLKKAKLVKTHRAARPLRSERHRKRARAFVKTRSDAALKKGISAEKINAGVKRAHQEVEKDVSKASRFIRKQIRKDHKTGTLRGHKRGVDTIITAKDKVFD